MIDYGWAVPKAFSQRRSKSQRRFFVFFKVYFRETRTTLVIW